MLEETLFFEDNPTTRSRVGQNGGDGAFKLHDSLVVESLEKFSLNLLLFGCLLEIKTRCASKQYY